MDISHRYEIRNNNGYNKHTHTYIQNAEMPNVSYYVDCECCLFVCIQQPTSHSSLQFYRFIQTQTHKHTEIYFHRCNRITSKSRIRLCTHSKVSYVIRTTSVERAIEAK